ncbi:MAG: phage holin family protein [Collinsella sp.]|nr:phage holin family protein [Collinsella sp.]
MRFLLNWLLTSIAIAIATFVVPGIAPFGPTEAWLSFAGVGLFLSLVNFWVKPLVTLISLPFTCLTLGIFQLVVNSFMLELASWLSVNLLGVGIAIEGFLPALVGSILISILCSILGVAAADAQ